MRLAQSIATALLATLTWGASAATVTGTLSATTQGGYMGQIYNLSTTDGPATLPASAFVVCIDPFANYPTAGSTHRYELQNTLSGLVQHAAASDRATALVHYALDHYLAPLQQGVYGTNAGYAFNQILWEITADFTGSASSLSTRSGSIQSSATRNLYTDAVSTLRADFSTISSDYRSSRYDIWFLDDANSSYQSLAMVSEREPHAVPLPSTALLMFAGGLGLFLRPRRRQA